MVLGVALVKNVAHGAIGRFQGHGKHTAKAVSTGCHQPGLPSRLLGRAKQVQFPVGVVGVQALVVDGERSGITDRATWGATRSSTAAIVVGGNAR